MMGILTRRRRTGRLTLPEGLALLLWIGTSCWSVRIALAAASDVLMELSGRLLAGGIG